MPRQRSSRLNQCRCEVCNAFNRERSDVRYLGRWQTYVDTRGLCDVCGRDDLQLAELVPALLTEFLGYERLCWGCRNGIDAYTGEAWQLCWRDSDDQSLKWAMLDWLRSNHWLDAFWIAQKGYRTREEAFYGEMDKDLEKRAYWMAHGAQHVKVKIHQRWGMEMPR